jgi:hypothetical protein
MNRRRPVIGAGLIDSPGAAATDAGVNPKGSSVVQALRKRERGFLMRRQHAVMALVALTAITFASAPPASAGSRARPFSGAFRAPTVAHYAVQPQEEEFYGEEFELIGWDEAGNELSMNIVISNLGFGDNSAVVKAKWSPKGGKSAKGSKKFDEDDWSHSKRPFRIHLGANSLSGGPSKLVAVAKFGAVEMKLTFENLLPAWRPGNGRAYYGSRDLFYDLTIMAPRAKVTGTIKAGGKTHQFDGQGYADHRVSNVAPHVAGRRWVRFRSFEGDWTFILQELHFPRNLGGARSTFLLVGYKDRIVFQTLRYKMRLGDVHRDRNKDTPYSYPGKMEITAKAGDRTLRATITGKLRRRADLLDGIGRMKRSILIRFARPVGYYLDGSYSLEVSRGEAEKWTASGAGSYYVKQVTR